MLIRYYIKFDDIVDWVIDGLGRVGIDVAQKNLSEKSKTLQKPCIINSHNKPLPNPAYMYLLCPSQLMDLRDIVFWDITG